MTSFTIDSTVLSHSGFSLDTSDIPESSIHRMLFFAFRQMLDNSIAGITKKLEDAGKTTAEIDVVLAAKMKAVLDKMLAGTLADRATGPRAQGIEKYLREVAETSIRKNAQAKGKKLPTGKELTAMITRLLADEKTRAALLPRAQRAMDDDADLPAIDVDLTDDDLTDDTTDDDTTAPPASKPAKGKGKKLLTDAAMTDA